MADPRFSDKVSQLVHFTYKNHRGEIRNRIALPIQIWYGSTAWHPDAQWFWQGFDIEKMEIRDFAEADFIGPRLPYHLPDKVKSELAKVFNTDNKVFDNVSKVFDTDTKGVLDERD